METLQDLIRRINKSFSFFFKSMKCAGEVDLHIPENPVRVSRCCESQRSVANFESIACVMETTVFEQILCYLFTMKSDRITKQCFQGRVDWPHVVMHVVLVHVIVVGTKHLPVKTACCSNHHTTGVV